MRLSKRLKAIAMMVDDNTHIIDVGCDHGLMGIYAIMHKKNCTCLAIDSNTNALKVAIANINKYKLNDSIKAVKNEGLDNVVISENDIVVLSGLGTRTIKNILRKTDIASLKTIIIQSNNDLYDLRKYIVKLGFYIIDEQVVFEKDKYYVIIKFSKGSLKYTYMDYYLGPKIRKHNNEYVNYLIDTKRYILSTIPSSNFIRKLKIRILIHYLKKELI